MIITGDPNYLAHYGVIGMKWGVRKRSSGGRGGGSSKIKKFAKNRAEKYIKKREEKNKTLRDQTNRWGVAGVAVSRYMRYSAGHRTRGFLANVINASANAYISSNSSKYYISKGIDFARNASIAALSIKDTADKINAYADVGKAAIYANDKKRK